MNPINFEISDEVGKIVDLIMDDYEKGKDIDQINIFNKPDKAEVRKLADKLMQIVFPGYFKEKAYRVYQYRNTLAVLVEDIFYNLNKQIRLALHFSPTHAGMRERILDEEAAKICLDFFRGIPKVRALVETDLQATFDGDPAAKSKEEIVLAYPGIMASTVGRLAHELYILKVPLIPRLMTEYVHSETGIDIHPGATIGRYFCIDHGTGIVVGETTFIGNHVKMYQGVTLGALSTKDGQKLRGTKRHPTIEDNVTLYSGASILGGNTIIGHDSVIGGNVFITQSVPPNTKVNIKSQELIYRKGDDIVEVPIQESKADDWFTMI